MSDKKEKDKSEKTAGKRRTPFSVLFAYFMLFVTALVFLPTTIVFVVCMVPTLVATIIDNQVNRTAWFTVGAMNLAGVVPVWFSLWDMGHTIPAAFNLITQPMTIITSYGGAAAGWFIYHNITPLVAGIVLNKNERRLREIEKRQKELLRKWGKEVTQG